MVIPKRTTQPYRVGGQAMGQMMPGQMPGMALQAMQRGRTAGGMNPMDQMRGSMPVPGSLAWLLLNLSAGRPTIPRR